MIRRTDISRTFLLAAAALAVAAGSVYAQETAATRSNTVGAPKPEMESQGRDVVAVIGIDDYRHWRDLQNGVHDARGVYELLTREFGFHADSTYILADTLATRGAIEDLVKNRLANELTPDDRLVLFFAGHGHTRVQGAPWNDTTGYLVPVGGKPPAAQDWNSYIEINEFLGWVDLLPPLHILVILDACHSGTGLSLATVSEEIAEISDEGRIRYASRRVITSAQGNQLALDIGGPDGHSLFTGWLREGLRLGLNDGADLDQDTIVQTHELGEFVQRRVTEQALEQEHVQQPEFGAMPGSRRHRGGDWGIRLPIDDFARLYMQAWAEYRDGAETFLEVAGQALALGVRDARSTHLAYLVADEEEDDQAAVSALAKLVDLGQDGLDAAGVDELHRRLEKRLERLCGTVDSADCPADGG